MAKNSFPVREEPCVKYGSCNPDVSWLNDLLVAAHYMVVEEVLHSRDQLSGRKWIQIYSRAHLGLHLSHSAYSRGLLFPIGLLSPSLRFNVG